MITDSDQNPEMTGLHVCPVCSKLFLSEKAMYLHIMRAHKDAHRLAYSLRADMYKRWRDRHPRVNQ